MVYEEETDIKHHLKTWHGISLEEATTISELSGLDKCSSGVLQCWATYLKFSSGHIKS